MKAFRFHHVVGFEETNLVGNVYYTNHFKWQGRCRELFLAEHAPEILAELKSDLALATVRCACDYTAELEAFDRVVIEMRLVETRQNRITLGFDYFRRTAEGDEPVARGEMVVASMRRTPAGTVPCPIPEALRQALEPYGR